MNPHEAWGRWKALTGSAPPSFDLPLQPLIDHYGRLGDPESAVRDSEEYTSGVLGTFRARLSQFVVAGLLWWVGTWELVVPFTYAEALAALYAMNWKSTPGIDFIDGALVWEMA